MAERPVRGIFPYIPNLLNPVFDSKAIGRVGKGNSRSTDKEDDRELLELEEADSLEISRIENLFGKLPIGVEPGLDNIEIIDDEDDDNDDYEGDDDDTSDDDEDEGQNEERRYSNNGRATIEETMEIDESDGIDVDVDGGGDGSIEEIIIVEHESGLDSPVLITLDLSTDEELDVDDTAH